MDYPFRNLVKIFLQILIGFIIDHLYIAHSIPIRVMEILMEQWGYSCSVYSLKAKCWVLFKKKTEDFEERISDINEQLKISFFYLKNGFVDYWKGF